MLTNSLGLDRFFSERQYWTQVVELGVTIKVNRSNKGTYGMWTVYTGAPAYALEALRMADVGCPSQSRPYIPIQTLFLITAAKHDVLIVGFYQHRRSDISGCRGRVSFD